ncbi:MAG: glutamate-5-semialdehyde dehydrogenase [Chloroflexi bacterium]|nr:glutamate-5-semialdehyde dehydrogenase [Chloroflexota bacterium]
MVETVCRQARESAYTLAAASEQQLNRVLRTLATRLEAATTEIIQQNKLDIATAEQLGQSKAFIDRLTLTPARVEAMAQGVLEIAALRSRTGKILEERTLENGVLLRKVAVPLGVIGIIYESRPNVTVDAAALSLKSGNAVVLKGGSESLHSNRFLVGLIQEALTEAGLPTATVGFINSTERAATLHLLKQDKYLDVLIPRGGYELVRAVVENSAIPVLYHAEGGVRIYVDPSADLAVAQQVAFNAKTSRPSTCNTLDTLVLHRAIAADFLVAALPELRAAGVRIRADETAIRLLTPELALQVEQAEEEDWGTEYLDLILSVKIVDSFEEALDFIRHYSKRHTEGLIATDQTVIDTFVRMIDAAALMINCSPRLHDGGIFGLGAEMGISTGKLHARGPVGLDELATYKWVALGKGQIRK